MGPKPTKTPQQRGKSARNKGKRGELELCEELRGIFPKVGRHLEYQKEHAKGYDLDGTGSLRIQIKTLKNYAPINKLEEVHPEPGTIPVLATKGDRKPWRVCLGLDDFKSILTDVGTALDYSENSFADVHNSLGFMHKIFKSYISDNNIEDPNILRSYSYLEDALKVLSGSTEVKPTTEEVESLKAVEIPF